MYRDYPNTQSMDTNYPHNSNNIIKGISRDLQHQSHHYVCHDTFRCRSVPGYLLVSLSSFNSCLNLYYININIIERELLCSKVLPLVLLL